MYNRLEIEKNRMLFKSSLDEVFAKLVMSPNEILYQRAETTLELAESAKESLLRFKGDEYVDNVILELDYYKARFQELKTTMLKSHAELQYL